jgi:hypothetical protein
MPPCTAPNDRDATASWQDPPSGLLLRTIERAAPLAGRRSRPNSGPVHCIFRWYDTGISEEQRRQRGASPAECRRPCTTGCQPVQCPRHSSSPVVAPKAPFRWAPSVSCARSVVTSGTASSASRSAPSMRPCWPSNSTIGSGRSGWRSGRRTSTGAIPGRWRRSGSPSERGSACTTMRRCAARGGPSLPDSRACRSRLAP